MITNDDSRRVFHDFCKKEFCGENIDFLEKLKLFVSLLESEVPNVEEKARELAKDIYCEFLASDAPQMLSIGGPLRAEVEVAIASKNRKVETDLFDECAKAVLRTLAGALYPRFIVLPGYREVEKIFANTPVGVAHRRQMSYNNIAVARPNGHDRKKSTVLNDNVAEGDESEKNTQVEEVEVLEEEDTTAAGEKKATTPVKASEQKKASPAAAEPTAEPPVNQQPVKAEKGGCCTVM